MKPLSAHRILQLATNAVPILKHLAMTNGTMTPKEFGQALGIVHQAWKPEYREHIDTVLKVVETTFDTLNAPPLEFRRVLSSDPHEGHWHRGHWKYTGASK
jgi:hypothetical protein